MVCLVIKAQVASLTAEQRSVNPIDMSTLGISAFSF